MDAAWLEDSPLEECLRLLDEHSVGRIAVVVNDVPRIMPVNYRLVESTGPRWLALRTRAGNLVERASTNVAFEIDDLDPARQQGWSVVVGGTLHHVDPDAADFRERFDPQPWIVAERDAWMAIAPFSITGRRLHAPGGEWTFPGAVHRAP
jgi:nitroimidazol reductase NimA-like FMN-containing flavoprotein (pyridoxamine 5'-phosphate oxidase superfamily)